MCGHESPNCHDSNHLGPTQTHAGPTNPTLTSVDWMLLSESQATLTQSRCLLEKAEPVQITLYASSLSCDIHTHTPAKKSSTNVPLCRFPLRRCSTKRLGHGHGHDLHSPWNARARAAWPPGCRPVLLLGRLRLASGRRALGRRALGRRASGRRASEVGGATLGLRGARSEWSTYPAWHRGREG